ncbi:MAG: DUF1385 domain-containing protein [Dehalococcoidia bacterium]|nr:DUF1385 domain-containing protein [Dehalococcoidia bacterium]
MAQRPFYYGGQAVIEGVMMRGQHFLAVAVRRPHGEIDLQVRPLAALYRGRLRQIPFVRGIIVLIESLAIGTRALFDSAAVALEEENEKSPTWYLWLAVAVGMAIGIAGFFILPMLITRYLIYPIAPSNVLAVLSEGVIRVGLFIGYLAAISRMKDVQRVFAYHGAEHKTVNAYEGGMPLTVEAIQKFSTAHIRCGTSFILNVLVIAIIVFAFIGQPSVGTAIAWRILLIPVIASLSYELTRFGGGHSHNRLVRAVLAPGIWLQSLTTREPDDRQVETAIAALQAVIEADRGGQGRPVSSASSP